MKKIIHQRPGSSLGHSTSHSLNLSPAKIPAIKRKIAKVDLETLKKIRSTKYTLKYNLRALDTGKENN